MWYRVYSVYREESVYRVKSVYSVYSVYRGESLYSVYIAVIFSLVAILAIPLPSI